MQIDQDQERALVEKLTEGRGGAFFYYSHDRLRTPPPPPKLSSLLLFAWLLTLQRVRDRAYAVELLLLLLLLLLLRDVVPQALRH